MDPLSITTSAFAIIGAIDQTRKCVNKLRAMRKAPVQMAELCEEVEEFHTTLCQVLTVKTTIEANERSAQQHRGAIAGLTQIVERGRAKLDRLHHLIPDSFDEDSPNHGAKKSELWAWSKRYNKATKLRDGLRGIQLSLIISLASITSSTNLETQNAIEPVARAVLDHDQPHIIRENTQNVLQINLGVGHLSEETQNPPPQYSAGSSAGGSNSDMTRRLPKLSDAEVSATDRRQASTKCSETETTHTSVVLPRNTCPAWCSCRCHKRTHFKSASPLDFLLGSISTDSHGMTRAVPECNEHACRRRFGTSLRVTYRPPKWLSNHLLQFSMRLSSSQGPEINVKLPRMVGWYNPLWKFACEGNIVAIRDLYASGAASPWDVNPFGGSVLHYAVERRHWNVCSLLLGNGATPVLEDKLGGDPTAMAWEHILSGNLSDNEASATRSLFENEEYLESRQFSVLHKIVLGLIEKDIKSMLELSTAEIDRVDANGRTCVSWAAARGDDRTLRTLLEFGADPNIVDHNGMAALHHVTGIECCKTLLTHSALVTVRDKHGRTAMHWNCRVKGDVQVLDALHEAGADLDAKDKSNETPLANAILNGFTECAHALLDKNADITAASRDGDDALRHAIQKNSHDILERLIRHQDFCSTSINTMGHTMAHTIARAADARTIELLSDKQLDPRTLTMIDAEGQLPISFFDKRVEQIDVENLRNAFTNLFTLEEKQDVFVDAVEVFDDDVDEIVV